MPRLAAALFLLLAALCGCAGRGPVNPSFPLTGAAARRAMGEMANSPQSLDRPVVVLGGMNDPGIGPAHLAREVRRLTGDRRVLPVTFGFFESLDAARRRVIRDVDRRFPSEDADATAEVDVVAVSMGGVVARHAAASPPGPGGRRLRIARLFTISSPHRGAASAALPALPFSGTAHRDLRARSRFLRALAERERREAPAYELYPYVRLGDVIVGAPNASPPGDDPLWVPTPPLECAHLTAYRDPRIVADIARRLRGEPPFAGPPTPLPGRGRG